MLVAVAMDVGGVKDCKPIYEAAGAKFVTLVDPQNAMGEAWGFKLVPNGWLLDESMTLVKKWVGGFEVRSPRTVKDVEDFLQLPKVAPGQVTKAPTDEERVRTLKQTLEKDKEDPAANLALGQILLRQGKAKEAMPYLGNAVRLDPKSANALFAMGSCLLAQGEKQTALTVLRNALKLDPANYLIRKQIWHVEHPEKFHPVIDWAWQREQLARERDGGG